MDDRRWEQDAGRRRRGDDGRGAFADEGTWALSCAEGLTPALLLGTQALERHRGSASAEALSSARRARDRLRERAKKVQQQARREAAEREASLASARVAAGTLDALRAAESTEALREALSSAEAHASHLPEQVAHPHPFPLPPPRPRGRRRSSPLGYIRYVGYIRYTGGAPLLSDTSVTSVTFVTQAALLLSVARERVEREAARSILDAVRCAESMDALREALQQAEAHEGMLPEQVGAP